MDRWCLVPAWQRHTQKAGRLVDDNQVVVLEEDLQLTEVDRPGRAPRTAGSIHPDTDEVSRLQTSRRIRKSGFDIVDEYLSSFERCNNTAARAKPVRCSQKLVEPAVLFVGLNVPLRTGCRHSSARDVQSCVLQSPQTVLEVALARNRWIVA